jgi:hypothetical protein
MWIGSIENHGTLWADNTTHGTAVGAFVGATGTVTNSGDILASAVEGDAYGIQTWDDRRMQGLPSVINESTGYIGADSQLGWAIGILAGNAPILQNMGTVDVSGGDGAIAIDMGLYSGGRLVNAGEIYAGSPSTKTVSIGVDFYDYGHLTNSGVISADIAVLVKARYGYPTEIANSGQIYGTILESLYENGAHGSLWLTNTNLIVGDVWVDDDLLPISTQTTWDGKTVVVDDLVINSGRIQGNVSLAAGNDIFDGRGGQVDGVVFGGDGNDILVGGSNADILDGGTGADTLTGGAGKDTLKDTAAGLSGDTITDFSAGDKIVISDANLAAFSFSLSGNTLTFTGGSLTLSSVPSGTIVASAAAGGGVQLIVAQHDPANDFNGDGRSDILWRDDGGVITDWLGQANGGFAANWGNSFKTVTTDWHVAGTGDFNGDGRDDILWRNDNGLTVDWLGQANGGFASNYANSAINVPTSWAIAGIGDFNGDGKEDILWRDTASGLTVDWLGQANGSFASNWANSVVTVPTDWKVAGIGDFNGDGLSDILWRNSAGLTVDWLGQASGGFTNNWNNSAANVPTDWKVAGTGDFNGDGHDDILWRSDSGWVTEWLGQANGGFTNNWANMAAGVPTDWHVASIGDFNGDGKDDVLWRSDSGQTTDWLGSSSGGFSDNYSNAASFVPTSWHVQAEAFL